MSFEHIVKFTFDQVRIVREMQKCEDIFHLGDQVNVWLILLVSNTASIMMGIASMQNIKRVRTTVQR